MPGNIGISDLSWKGWGLLAAIIGPLALGSYFVGTIVHDIGSMRESISLQLQAATNKHDAQMQEIKTSIGTQMKLVTDTFAAQLQARDIKLNYVYDQINKGDRYTADRGEKAEARLTRVEAVVAACQPKLERVMEDVAAIRSEIREDHHFRNRGGGGGITYGKPEK